MSYTIQGILAFDSQDSRIEDGSICPNEYSKSANDIASKINEERYSEPDKSTQLSSERMHHWNQVLETLAPGDDDKNIYKVTSDLESNVEEIATHIKANDNLISASDAKSYMDKLESIQGTAVQLSTFSMTYDSNLNTRHEKLTIDTTDKLITHLEKIIKQQEEKIIKQQQEEKILTLIGDFESHTHKVKELAGNINKVVKDTKKLRSNLDTNKYNSSVDDIYDKKHKLEIRYAEVYGSLSEIHGDLIHSCNVNPNDDDTDTCTKRDDISSSINKLKNAKKQLSNAVSDELRTATLGMDGIPVSRDISVMAEESEKAATLGMDGIPVSLATPSEPKPYGLKKYDYLGTVPQSDVGSGSLFNFGVDTDKYFVFTLDNLPFDRDNLSYPTLRDAVNASPVSERIVINTDKLTVHLFTESSSGGDDMVIQPPLILKPALHPNVKQIFLPINHPGTVLFGDDVAGVFHVFSLPDADSLPGLDVKYVDKVEPKPTITIPVAEKDGHMFKWLDASIKEINTDVNDINNIERNLLKAKYVLKSIPTDEESKRYIPQIESKITILEEKLSKLKDISEHHKVNKPKAAEDKILKIKQDIKVLKEEASRIIDESKNTELKDFQHKDLEESYQGTLAEIDNLKDELKQLLDVVQPDVKQQDTLAAELKKLEDEKLQFQKTVDDNYEFRFNAITNGPYVNAVKNLEETKQKIIDLKAKIKQLNMVQQPEVQQPEVKDTEAPFFNNGNMNMQTGILTLQFSEPIDRSNINSKLMPFSLLTTEWKQLKVITLSDSWLIPLADDGSPDTLRYQIPKDQSDDLLVHDDTDGSFFTGVINSDAVRDLSGNKINQSDFDLTYIPPVVAEPDVQLPEVQQPDIVAPEPDIVAPEPDVVAPEPDIVAPEPDVVAPEPDVVAPEPDVVAPEINREHALANNQQLGIEEVQKKKKSGGGSDWKKRPTFGLSHNTNSQLVQNGFTLNGYTVSINDNWHTEWLKTSSIIGEENHVRVTSYAADGFKYVTLSLGVPEIGKSADAETGITIHLDKDYSKNIIYSVSDITHEQKENLIDESKTEATVSQVYCNGGSNAKNCYAFDVWFTVLAPLSHDVLAITAVDEKRRTQVTYINDGVEFTGESLLEPDVKELWHDKEWITLTKDDRRYNTWTDDNGYKWNENSFGSMAQITFPDFERFQDDYSSVMNRLNSNFELLIQHEKEKALQIWNGTHFILE